MNLRELLGQAASDVAIYKNPNIDDFKREMSKVLAALGRGSIIRDNVDSIDEQNSTVTVKTSYVIRGCEHTNFYRIPSFIIDSEDPVKAARIWKLKQALDEAVADLDSMRAGAILLEHKVETLKAQLFEANQ